MTEDQGLSKPQSKKQSYWPFALAFSLTIALVGVMSLPIILWIGVALVAVSFIGWGLERH